MPVHHPRSTIPARGTPRRRAALGLALAALAAVTAACSGVGQAGSDPPASAGERLPAGFVPPKPTVTSVSPGSGSQAGGTTLTIVGRHFGGFVRVLLGRTPCTGVTVSGGETTITCVAPSASLAGPRDVVIESSTNGTVIVTSAFTYVALPTIVSLSPTSGPLAGGTAVTVSGSNFGGTVTATVGGVAATVLSVSANLAQVTIQTPAASTAGPRDVQISSTANGTARAEAAFSYLAPPSITQITPTQGPSTGGTRLTIDGFNFGGVISVSVGVTATTNLTVNSAANRIMCDTASSTAGSRDVLVSSTTNGTVSAASAFTYIAVPSITTVTPSSGPLAGSNTVTIDGASFPASPSVTFGGRPASGVSVNVSGTQLMCLTPASSAAGAVAVTVAATSNVSATLAGGYTYNAAPTIATVSPSSGPLAGGTTLTIDGTGFGGTVNVTVGSTAATGILVSGTTQITAVTPAQTSAGAKDVVVSSSTNGTVTRSGAFTYLAPPSITDITPASGRPDGGTPIVIKGANFAGTVNVTIGSAAATGVSVSGTTQIACVTPAGTVGLADVAVGSSTNGTVTASRAFAFNPRPSVSAVSPTSGPLGGGTLLSITGQNFGGTVNVTIATLPATGAVADPDGRRVLCTTPAGAAAGAVDVAVGSTTNGTVSATGAFTYNALPTTTGVTPTVGYVTGGTVVTITGTGFQGTVNVTFGNAVAETLNVSATRITARTPPAAAAGTVDVTVTSSRNGTVVRPAAFTYLAIPNVAFACPLLVRSGTGPRSAVIASINGDAFLDLVTANAAAGTISVMLGQTSSPTVSFGSPTSFASGTLPWRLVTADINADGLADVAVVNQGSDTLSVFINTTPLGTSPPTFAAKGDFTTGRGPSGIAAGDINADAKPDIVVTNSAAGTISVFINTTTAFSLVPTFAPRADVTALSSPLSVAIIDITGDASPDVVATNLLSDKLSVFGNLTPALAIAPVFAPRADFATGKGPQGLVAADLNADTRPDLAVASSTDATVSVLLNTSPGASATATFATAARLFAGDGPVDVVAADIDVDGRVDLAVAARDSLGVEVLLSATQAAATTASFAGSIQVPAGGAPVGIAVADLDGNAKPDLVVPIQDSNVVSVLVNHSIGTPTATFGAGTAVTAGNASPYGVAGGDINRDGRRDLVFADTGPTVSIVLNTTPAGSAVASFTLPVTATTGTGPLGVALGDLDGDGDLDIIVANSGSDTVSVFRNSTAIGGSPATVDVSVTFATGSSPAAVSVADINLDGRPDLAVTNNGAGANTVSVLLNTTSGGAISFASGVTFQTGTAPLGIVADDLTGDGKPDLAVTNTLAASISVLVNQTSPGATTPSFNTRVDFGVGPLPRGIAAGDINGDGRVDLALADASSGNVSVFLNLTVPGSSAPSFTTRADFAVAAGPQGIALGDVDGDCRLDVVTACTTAGVGSVLLNLTPRRGSEPDLRTAPNIVPLGAPSTALVLEINEDRRADVVLGAPGASAVYLNTTPP